MVSRGNARADAAAKQASLISTNVDFSLTQISQEKEAETAQESLISMQTFSLPTEIALWKSCGATKTPEGIWMGPNQKPCLPKHFFPHFARLTHGLDHVSKGGMLTAMAQNWFTKGFSPVAQRHCENCHICLGNNVARGVKTAPVGHPIS